MIPEGTTVFITRSGPYIEGKFATVMGFGYPSTDFTGRVQDTPRSGLDYGGPKYLVKLHDNDRQRYWLFPDKVQAALSCDCGKLINSIDYLCKECRNALQ